MKNLSRNEAIAVFAGVSLMAFLFFSEPLTTLFTRQVNQNNQMPQTGFTMEDRVVGQGELAENGDILTVHYTGRLTDSQIFDSSFSRNEPIKFTLGTGQVIRGWDEGVRGMREGGKRIIIIASDYGYGNRAVGPIPANSTLVFEVELLDVQKSR